MQEIKAKTNLKTIQWMRSRNCDNRKIDLEDTYPGFKSVRFSRQTSDIRRNIVHKLK